MTLAVVLLGLAAAAPPAKIEPVAAKAVDAVFAKVGPTPLVADRPAKQTRAVVLIHGLGISLFSSDRVATPAFRAWQQGDSVLVQRLAKDSDVYSYCYGQTVAVDRVCEAGQLPGYIRTLKKMGYAEIVLVGHSAGGLIARTLVEDMPNLGVTRVVQVCAPNLGSALASLRTARSVQMDFLNSLTKAARAKALEDRGAKPIPPAVSFACVVGWCPLGGDGVVPCASQWSADLQGQGVPAFSLRTTHREAVRSKAAADLIAKLVTDSLPRWDKDKVAKAKKEILGE